MKLRIKTDTIEYLSLVPLTMPPSYGPIREVSDSLVERFRKHHLETVLLQAELALIKKDEL